MNMHFRHSGEEISGVTDAPPTPDGSASAQIAAQVLRVVKTSETDPAAFAPAVEVLLSTSAETPEAAAIIDQSKQFQPFQLPEWGHDWQQAVGSARGASPVTAIVRRGGSIVAVLPLALQQGAFLRTLTWHAENLSDYGAPALPGSATLLAGCDIAGLLTEAARKAGNVDVICLSKQPGSLAGHANPFVLPGSIEHHVSAHAINFRPGESWDDFLARTRSSSTRQQLRKKQRNLAKLGSVEFRVAATAEEAADFIRHCLDGKSKQLAKLGHFDPFTSAANRTFIAEYFTRHATSSTWAVALLLNGKPIASAFGFTAQRQWLLYQMAMDGEGTAQTSPGTQLLMQIMQHCIANGIGRLDLAMGDEGYKQEWCDEHQTLYTTIVPVSTKGRIAGGMMRQVAIASKKIAGHETLYNLAKSAKRKAQKLLARG